MAILLIDQLQRPTSKLLMEVRYQADLSDGQQTFWDFYAMYALWYRVGSGFEEYWQGKHENPVQVTSKRRAVIDDVMDQITRQLARGLITYLKLACLAELRHIIDCSDFITFRQDLVYARNASGTITKERFKSILNSRMPDVSVELAQKLLRFGKYYSPTDTGDKDISTDADKAVSQIKGTDKPDIEIPDEPEKVSDIEPEPSLEPDEPEVTGEPEVPEIDPITGEFPGEPDPASHDYGYNYPSGDFDPEDPFDKKKKKSVYKEYIKQEPFVKSKGTSIIFRNKADLGQINNARAKAGMTMYDVVDAYFMVPWHGKMGGASWGEGTKEAIRASEKLQTYPTIKLIEIIDHIYDLYHNTGLILNKGPLHVPSNVLDARARIKSIPRFLPHVSGLVKALIINNFPYLSDENPAIEMGKEKQIENPSDTLPADQEKIIKDLGFKWHADSYSYMVPMKFEGKSKPGDPPNIRYIPYHLKVFPDGSIYTYDGDLAEINRFVPTTDEAGTTIPAITSAATYLNTIKHMFQPVMTPPPPPVYKPMTPYTSVFPSQGHATAKTYNKNDPYSSGGMTAAQYSNELPPHSNSKAMYIVHKGISELPKQSIRLTIDDEANITTLGFEPKMVSGQVWYVHKTVGDTIQFYPNDFAKLRFTGKMGPGAPVVNMDISMMLGWLPMKYSATLTKSPIKVAAPPKTEKGKKAGGMFEKYILNAGFVWDEGAGVYKDGGNVLKMSSNSSTLKLANGTQKVFGATTNLLAFLMKDYPKIKAMGV